MAHSKYSASGFEAARLCPGKPVLEAGLPDNGNGYAREGTAAHQVLEWCLQRDHFADAYEGRIIDVEGDPILVDDDMVGHINWCLEQIETYAGGNAIMAETRVNYSDALGVAKDEGWGTADVIVPRDDGELVVMDLKYGRGVEVDADCDQLKLYGLGALAAVDGLLGDFERVRLVVLQPRISRAPSEHDMTVTELRQWAATTAWEAVERRQLAAEFMSVTPVEHELWAAEYLSPNEKSCKFCKAKATCPALQAEVGRTVSGDNTTVSAENFEPFPAGQATHPDELATCLNKVDMIEDWCKAVRAEAERRLLDGREVPGYKLVQGKRGNRQWADAKAAEQMLKTFRVKLEDMYEMKLINPTTAEKLAKAETIGKRQWPKLQELIVQSEGKPHVAPESDSRPALVRQPVAEMFDPADFA